MPTTARAAASDLGALGSDGVSIAARWLGPAGRSDLAGVALAADNGEEVMVPGDVVSSATVGKKLNALLSRPVVGHQVKEVMRTLLPLGVDITGLSMDTAVAAYLLDVSSGEYELDDLGSSDGQLQMSMGDDDAESPMWPKNLLIRPRPMPARWRSWPANIVSS